MATPKKAPKGRDGLPLYNFFWHEEHALLSEEVRALEEIASSLDEVYRLLIERLARAVRAWDIITANMLLQEIGRHMNMWQAALNATVGDAMEKAWNTASAQVLTTMKAGGVLTVSPFIPRDALIVSQATLPVLIKGISDETMLGIARDLRLSVLGGLSPQQFLARLGGPPPRPGQPEAPMEQPYDIVPLYRPLPGQAAIQSGPFTGYLARKTGRVISAIGRFPTAFHRAEAILRTEMGRVSSIANQLTLEQVDHTNPGMQKQWSSILDARVRPAHREAHGQLVGVRESFTVAGESLRYPRDPGASASNVVNCRCVALPWNPEWEKYGFTTALKPPESKPWVWEEKPHGSWKPPLDQP